MSILIVDDSPHIRTQLEIFLKTDGYTNLHFAESAAEAFHILGIGDCGIRNQKTTPAVSKEKRKIEVKKQRDEIQDSQTRNPRSEIDLILMDIEMPEIDGIEACRRIKENQQLQDIPIIMVTAKSEAEDLQTAFEAGVVDYITKPLNKVELRARVRSVLRLKDEMDQRKAREKDLLKTTKELNITLGELEKRNRQMENELDIAHEIQTGIVPQKERMQLLSDHYSLDISSVFKPCNQLGGDFWDVIELDENKIGIIIIDFAGHGIAPSLNTFRIKEFIYNSGNETKSPATFMKILNDKILKSYNMHATCFYAVYDKTNKNFTYCRAGHPYGIWYKKSEDKLISLDSKGTCLGFFPDSKYEEQEITLEEEDKVVFYTDGIIESRDKNDNFFGEDRLRNSILQNKERSSSVISNFIMKSLSEFLGEKELDDDITLVTINQLTNSKSGKVVIPSEMEHIEETIERIIPGARGAGFSDDRLTDIRLVLHEALSNAIKHGNKFHKDKEVRVEWNLANGDLKITVEDEGDGFKPDEVPNPLLSENLKKESGRGVHFLKQLAKEVIYNDNGNRVTIMFNK